MDNMPLPPGDLHHFVGYPSFPSYYRFAPSFALVWLPQPPGPADRFWYGSNRGAVAGLISLFNGARGLNRRPETMFAIPDRGPVPAMWNPMECDFLVCS